MDKLEESPIKPPPEAMDDSCADVSVTMWT